MLMKRNGTLLIITLLLITAFLSPEYTVLASDTDEVSNLAVYANYSVMNKTATITYSVSNAASDSVEVLYLRGRYKNPNHSNWARKGKDISDVSSFTVKRSGKYSIRVEDMEGNLALCTVDVKLEFRAVWIAYYELAEGVGKSEEDYRLFIGTMFDNAANNGMNAVIVHVRPFSDAMYKSKYYPWSKYASGTQGVSPGYDPLQIMVEEAHARDLELHAWLNPYRITSNTTDPSYLSADNPARKWLEDDNPDNDKNVIAYNGRLYYNPSQPAVRKLIINGIKEIVNKYDVDGIHFDDYFYPDYLGPDYASLFDHKDYEAYQLDCTNKGINQKNIVNWRRNNVNLLIKSIYKAVKSIDSSVVFGISPGGFIDYLLADSRYYVDFPTWLSTSKYIDYICPQLYWSFDKDNKFPYDTTLDRWIEYRTSATVKIYVGIAVYKMNEASQGQEWTNTDILYNMLEYANNTKQVDGFILFDYTSTIEEKNAEAMELIKNTYY